MKKIILIILLITPTFSLMLSPGIWTMHDFHLFRQFEFHKCIQAGVFPCRWAPDSGMGYGEPLFNFYTQIPYWLGETFHLSGLSIISSVKIVFAISLILSGVSMYILARRFWGRLGGLVSAIFYIFAPYRAVDVWVRGALPEALSFVLFPLIFLFLEKKSYLFFSISLALLLLTHNLSLFMFLPFLGIWWLVRSRDWKFLPAGILSLFLSAFYLLPVIFESHLVTVGQTTTGYLNYSLHWTTLRQLFISRFWGYGGSTWGPNDTLSFSVGHLHWIVVVVVGLVLLLRRSQLNAKRYFLFTSLALLAIFLTHGKSEIIWKIIPGLPFIQFPWRFLTMSTLFLSLSAGAITDVFRNKLLLSCSLALLLLFNFNYFKPDIWRSIGDNEQFSGALWDEQRSSALQDFWPKSAKFVPNNFAPPGATVYFPGWVALVDGVEKIAYPDSNGLVAFDISSGEHQIKLIFKDTLPRTLGNIISAATMLTIISWVLLRPKHA